MIGRAPSEGTFGQETIAADCFCAMPIGHPLTEKEQIDWRDLDGLPLGLLQSTHVSHRETVRQLENVGAVANVVLDSQFFLPMMPFISSGRCLSVVDPLTAVTEQEISTTGGQVVFRKLSGGFRYEYTIVAPNYRPLSQLALRVKEGWRDEVLALLTSIDAKPELIM